MLRPQKSYEKRVFSGLQPFSQYKPSKKYIPFIQSKPPADSSRTFLDFIKYFLVVFVVVMGLVTIFYFIAERDEGLVINQTIIESYIELLNPFPPALSSSSPTKPQQAAITKSPRNYPNGSDGSSDHNPSGSSSYSDKTVSVSGYYRSNGTYVSPHTRSAPSRK